MDQYYYNDVCNFFLRSSLLLVESRTVPIHILCVDNNFIIIIVTSTPQENHGEHCLIYLL